MEALREGHGQIGTAQRAVEDGLELQLAEVGAAAGLGMPDAVLDGLDGQLRRDLRRFVLVSTADDASFLVTGGLVGLLVALGEDQTVVVLQRLAVLAQAGMGHARRPGLGVAGAALAAGMVAAVFRDLARQRTLAFAAQEFGRDAGLQMFPGQVFVHAAGPGEFVGGQTAFFQSFQPGGQIETFDPAGEDAALAVDLFHHIGQAAVSAGKDAFQMAHGRFVPAQLEELLALEFVAHHLHTALDLFLADLFHPLEGREGLGHEGRERRRDLQARIALARGVAHLAAKVGDGLEVLVGLGGQADHEIEFDLTPAVFQQLLHMQQHLFLGDALVDDVTQALAARFGGQGTARAAQVGHALHDLVVDGAHAQRRQRKADLFLGAAAQHAVAQGLERGEVARAQRKEGDLVKARLFQAVVQQAGDGVQRPFAHRAVDHARVAETAAARTAAGDLQRQAVVHRADGHHLAGGVGHLVEVGHDAARGPGVVGKTGLQTAFRIRREERGDVDAVDVAGLFQTAVTRPAFVQGLFQQAQHVG